MIPGFLQYIGIGQFEACRGFEESLGNLSIDKLIERCTLVLLWLASSPELNGLNYRLVDNLFNKNYILLSSEIVTDFVHWVIKVRRDLKKMV